LRKLEERFPEELAVVGVHSAKFPAENHTFNVRQAVMRHDIRHPVVNDRDFLLWRAYATRAWPTLVIINPAGRVVGAHAGEFDADALGDLVEEIIRDFDSRGEIRRKPIQHPLEKWKQAETLLSFPGKVLADPEGGRLFVADTDHHRVALFGLEDGRLRASYGTGDPGFVDGAAGRACFHGPLGLALRGGSLYVADGDNHAVRKIALASGIVTTVAGTGEQATPWPSPGPAREARLNSPWDVLAIGNLLYVALAGSHQIWTVDLLSGELALFAGDGHEALLDGPRLSARLAQPSGLTTDGETLWFADSETSSVRAVPLPPLQTAVSPGEERPGDELLQTCIGQGLFEFGDRNGKREEARLQHALAVAAADGLVYVADSYNHKIKALDPQSGIIRTLAGSGEPGIYDGPAEEASFWEPGGLSAAGDSLYVADTNNHAVRVVDRHTGEVRTLDLKE
jgi:hypothetical protein